MHSDLQRLHALILLHHPSLAALSAAMGRGRHWAARRVSASSGSRVELTVTDLGAILAALGESSSRLDPEAGPILAEGDADLLDYLGGFRRRSAALQRTSAADLDRLELQGLIRSEADIVVITAAGLRVLTTLRGAP